VSRNQQAWSTVWQSPELGVSDASWVSTTHSIDAVADDQAAVYVRFGYRVFPLAFAFSGWNVDDIEILGRRGTAGLGDADCSGWIDFDDIPAFLLALESPTFYASLYPECDVLRSDADGDGDVDFDDIGPFVALLQP
jgi:hypothetical protein